MSLENYSINTSKFIEQLRLKKRLIMLKMFLKEFPLHTIKKILDCGVTSDKMAVSSNYLEKYFPDKSKIIALSNQDCKFLETLYPGTEFKLGDVTALPFEDASIDVVFSSAVLEHVGSHAKQEQMLAECYRVAKKGLFITTPNRWYPIEFHTLLPFIHWLPKKIHRWLLKIIGLDFFANGDNLNLLNIHTLKVFCRKLNIQNFMIRKIYTFGWPSNLILIIKKSEF